MQILTLYDSKHLTPDGIQSSEGSTGQWGLDLSDGVADRDDSDNEGHQQDGDEEGVGAGGSVQLGRLTAVYLAVKVLDVEHQHCRRGNNVSPFAAEHIHITIALIMKYTDFHLQPPFPLTTFERLPLIQKRSAHTDLCYH